MAKHMSRDKRQLPFILALFPVLIAINSAYPQPCLAKGAGPPGPAYVGWCVGMSDDGYGTILHTTNGGNTWNRQGSAASIPDTDLEAVAACDYYTCWVAGNSSVGYGTILRTTDGGATWARQGSPATIPDVDILKMSAVDAETAWAVGDSGTILFTGDGGRNWVQKQTPDVPAVLLQGVFAVDHDNVWVTGAPDAGYGTVCRTTDCGATWQRKGSPGVLPHSQVQDVHVTERNIAWFVNQTTGGTSPVMSVFCTADDGDTWSTFRLQTSGDANGVTATGETTVWVAADYNGIFKTDCNGLDHFPQQDPPPGTPSNYLLSITATDAGTAWVCGDTGAKTGNIYSTSDGGSTWTDQFYDSTAGLVGISMIAVPRPVLTGIAPSYGPAGTEVRLKGDHFGVYDRALSRVGFGGIQVTPEPSMWAAGRVKVRVPALPPGSYQVSVRNQGGVSNSKEFRVTVPPPDTSKWYLAEGSCAWGFSTYINIESPNDSEVTARVSYMSPAENSPSGKGVTLQQDIKLPAMSQTVLNPADALRIPCDFSTKVECLEGKSIAVDRTMVWTGKDAKSQEGHCSIGASSPSKTWYLPEGSSNWGFETWTLVENPNDTDAHITLTYMTEGRGAKSFKRVVPACSRASYAMATDIGKADASIKVESDHGVIAERSVYRNNRREGSCSIGATAPSEHFYLAEGTTAWGFTTYVLVQNPDSDPAEITLTCQTPDGPVTLPSFTLAGNSRKTVRLNDMPEVANRDLSIEVSATKPIAAERSMYWGSSSGEACHDSIGLPSPHMRFYLPDGQTSEGRETWTLVGNPNDEAVTVAIAYLSLQGKGTITLTDQLAPGTRKTYRMNDVLASGRASVAVKSLDDARPIVVERSMYWNDRGAGTGTIGAFEY